MQMIQKYYDLGNIIYKLMYTNLELEDQEKKKKQ